MKNFIVIVLFFVSVSVSHATPNIVVEDATGDIVAFGYTDLTGGLPAGQTVYVSPVEQLPDAMSLCRYNSGTDTVYVSTDLQLEDSRFSKIQEVEAEGLARIQNIDDSILTLGDAIRYTKTLVRFSALGVTLTANENTIVSIAQAGRDAIVTLNGYTSLGQITAFDSVDDVNWT